MSQYQKGQKDKALKNLSAAILSYDWSAAKADHRDAWIAHILRREAETMILPNTSEFLNGRYQPRNNDERLALLGICQFKGLHGTTARLCAAAFTADPKLAEDLKSGLRYRAARAAAQAGCSIGADAAKLSDEEKTLLRRQARTWLRGDLDAWNMTLESGPVAGRNKIRQTLTGWQKEPDLAGLRDSVVLAKLPQAEREECRVFWSDVDARLKQASVSK